MDTLPTPPTRLDHCSIQLVQLGQNWIAFDPLTKISAVGESRSDALAELAELIELSEEESDGREPEAESLGSLHRELLDALWQQGHRQTIQPAFHGPLFPNPFLTGDQTAFPYPPQVWCHFHA